MFYPTEIVIKPRRSNDPNSFDVLVNTLGGFAALYTDLDLETAKSNALVLASAFDMNSGINDPENTSAIRCRISSWR